MKSNGAKLEEKRSTQHERVEVDINSVRFLEEFEELDRELADQLLKALSRIERLSWDDIYRGSSKKNGDKRGINYEPLHQESEDLRVATIRISQRFRARVCREGRKMRLLSLHPDHDSAYEED